MIVCVAGVTLNMVSLFASLKPVIVPDQAYSLSISSQHSADTVTTGDSLILNSLASGETQRIQVDTIVPDGENTYQIETTLNTQGDTTTFTTGSTVWVEQTIIPVLGILFLPFSTLPAALASIILTISLATWYRWYFYGKNPKPVQRKTDEIGVLQNIFDNAPIMTKKEAQRLSK